MSFSSQFFLLLSFDMVVMVQVAFDTLQIRMWYAMRVCLWSSFALWHYSIVASAVAYLGSANQ